MRIYLQTGEAANGHKVRKYAASKTECAKIRAGWRKDGVLYTTGSQATFVPIDQIEPAIEIDLQTNKTSLLEFLNTRTPTITV